MKNIFLTLAAISVVLLGITLFQIYQTNKKSNFSRAITISDLKGFEDSGPNADAFKDLREKINSKITVYKEKEHKAAVWVLIVSFIVTALTGVSTLISTVKAARSPDVNSGQTIKLVAILTFFASLGNWGNSQFTDTRTKAITVMTNVKDLRTEFYTTYQQATGEKKKMVIDTYTDKLNDL